MKIGILAQLKQNFITGINRVTVGTLNELLRQDNKNEYYFLGRTNWLPVEIDYIDALYDSSDTIKLSFLVLTHSLDVVHSHSKAYEIDPHISCGKILTIHDMIPFNHPEWNNKQYDYFDGPLRKCAKEADVIIAVSDYTKKEVIDVYDIHEEKVKVVYSGLFLKKSFLGYKKKIRDISTMRGDYILSVSAIGANKNLKGIMDAFLSFKTHNTDTDLKLVFCGPIRQYDVIRYIEKAHENGLKDIVFTGFVSDDELYQLYSNAKAFIYASFCEGFGLPILEALYFGKAVICSNTSAMPEVGGDAVEYCNPYDTESIEHAISNVVLNDARRKELESRAVIQAQKFSYEKTAKETLEIYRMFE